MTVQELFQKVEPSRIEEAYFIQYRVFESYEKRSLDEKTEAVIRIKERIREHITRLATCSISEEEAQTIFVVELPCESYEDKGKTDLTLFSIYDDEAYQKVHTDFTVWDEEGERRINHYGIDMCKVEALAGYHVAAQCVETLGVLTCCVEILHELFVFGYSDESREKNIQDLCDSIEEAQKDIDEGRCYTHEEVFGRLWQSFLDECKDEDERQHMILEREYEKQVEEIEHRYTRRILEENHRKVISFIKDEYSKRAADEQEGIMR